MENSEAFSRLEVELRLKKVIDNLVNKHQMTFIKKEADNG